ncbi:MAG: hypothetical protein ACPG21_04005 [Crocinitomicaceae bacterium]
MKISHTILLFVIITLTACSGSKELSLDKKPLLAIENPQWFKVMPGQPDGKKFSVLILPVAVVLESYKPDSVYFQGYHEALQYSVYQDKPVYRAQFFEGTERPEIKPPYAIEKDQALMSYYTADSLKRYIRVTEIVQGEPVFMP